MVPKTSSPKQPKLLDVLIVGGGLSGLWIAHTIQTTLPAIRFSLLEARPVLGGRLANDSAGKEIDLGGAWVWPRHQPHIRAALAKQLGGVSTFAQPDEPSSTRMVGGAVRFIDELSKEIINQQGEAKIQLNQAVTSCHLEETPSGKVVRVETADQTLHAKRVIFSVPPRLLDKHVTFDPPLSSSKQAALRASQTWMAGVTKVALVYPNRFWSLDASNMGLPRSGPAFQVYDSSTKDGSVSALTFFALVPPNSPALSDDSLLAKQVADQMAAVWKYYGEPEAAGKTHSFTDFYIKRWPLEKYISEDARPTQINPHPGPVPALAKPEWDGLLEFAGSETDQSSPGVMEGAIGAAKRVLRSLEGFLTSVPAKEEQPECLQKTA